MQSGNGDVFRHGNTICSRERGLRAGRAAPAAAVLCQRHCILSRTAVYLTTHTKYQLENK